MQRPAGTSGAGNLPALEQLEPRLLLTGSVVISELLAINNNTSVDEDGDDSDWLEIHNTTGAPVDMTGWILKDTSAEWVFPAMTLGQNEYRVIFASDKDRRDPEGELHTNFKLTGGGEHLALMDPTRAVIHEYFPGYPPQLEDISYGLGLGSLVEETLLAEDAALSVLVPGSDLGLSWTQIGFDDSLWTAGTNGAGYDTATTYDSLIETDVQSEMYNQATTAYVRYSFNVTNPSRLSRLTLKMKYDDGFAAYINGVPVAGWNDPDPLTWQSAATNLHDDADAVIFEDFDATVAIGSLQEGENILAIHGLNRSSSSSDFLIHAKLLGYEATGDEVEQYFATPTPGSINIGGGMGVLFDTDFSVDRGFFDAPFDVTITTEDADAEIRYTLDGTDPTATHGLIYAGPIHISRTTTLRAAAFKPGYLSTNIDTQTYIFLDDVILQSPGGSPPPGWPAGPINGQILSYGMDPVIVNHWQYGPQLIDALKAIPTVSLVTDLDNLFDPGTGIYVHAGSDGRAWERPASFEWIYPEGAEGPGFPDAPVGGYLAGDSVQIDGGLRIRGGYSRSGNNPKHAFRLFFRDEYGDANFEYPLFGEEGVDRFDTVDLRTSQNYSWAFGGPNNNTMVRDVFSRDTQGAMGQPYTRSRYYHLYINGQYWGIYQTQERSEANYAADNLGGQQEDWDIVKQSDSRTMYATDGNMDAYYRLWQRTIAGFSSNAAYYEAQGLNPDGSRNPAYERLLDPENLVDYMIITYYTGDRDGPGSRFTAPRPNNIWCAYNREDPDGWKFFEHDSEHSLGTGEYNMVTPLVSGDSRRAQFQYFNPHWLHEQLTANSEYRMLFADRLYKHLYNGGVLTNEAALDDIDYRAEQIDLAIVAESARWGDQKFSGSGEMDRDDWLRDVQEVRNFIVSRIPTVVSQVRSVGWYPSIDPPTFNVHGGVITPGFDLVMGGGGGIYYTIDGTDPRLTGGGMNPEAVLYTSPIELNKTELVKARRYNSVTGEWSALHEAVFHVNEIPTLRATEIMYNPADPSPAEIAAGFNNNDDFEFLELRNVGAEPVYTGEMQFTDGIEFTFPQMVLSPGEFVVVVEDRDAFEYRYGTSANIAGQYRGNLSNAGETIRLETPLGTVLHEFTFADDWYVATDGEGYSLTIRDENASLDAWNLVDGWRGSESIGGTPGEVDNGLPIGSITVNEVLAHSDGGVEDWIELLNTTDQDIDISGWFLSDSDNNLTKYQIAPDTVLSPGEFLVLDEVNDFGPLVDPVNGFRLSELGDDVYLSSNAGGLPGGYREHARFPATLNGQTVGRHVNSIGDVDFTHLVAPSKGFPNFLPFVGDLTVNEIMFSPADPQPGGFGPEAYEFIELYNRSGSPLDLTEFVLDGGIGFSFGWYETRDGVNEAVWTQELGATAAWQANLAGTGAGDYEVFVWHSASDGEEGGLRPLDPSARYEVTHDGGTSVVQVDQGDGAGLWVSLGTFYFDPAEVTAEVTVTRTSEAPGRWTIADKVKFVKGVDEVIVDNDDVGFSTTGGALTSVPAGGYVILVKNLAAFDEIHDAQSLPVAGQYSGYLDNAGALIEVYRASTPELGGYVPYIRNDRVRYDDEAPWPQQPNGTGSSLGRIDPGAYGSDVANWTPGGLGTPGAENVDIDLTPPTVPGNLLAVPVTNSRIDLTWDASSDPDSWVDHYVIYRDGVPHDTCTSASYSDTGLDETHSYTYEVSAVNSSGFESARSAQASTTPRPSLQSAFAYDQTHVTVSFGKALEQTSAETIGNYTILDEQSQPAAILSAVLDADPTKVVLGVSSPFNGNNTYTVIVSNVTDPGGVAVVAGSQTTFVPRDIDPDLLAWWTFDEGSGPIAPDATGNERHLDILGGATWEPDGRDGGAMRFDGAAGTSLVDEDGENYVNGLGAVTVAMWIKSDVVGTDSGFFNTRDPGRYDCLNLRYVSDAWGGGADNTFSLFISTTTGASGDDSVLEGPADVQSTDWQHVALTWSDGGELTFYLDGVLQTPTFTWGSPAGTIRNATKVVVGKGEQDAISSWLGLIDDVRLYGRELGAQEVALLANVTPTARSDYYDTAPDIQLSVNASAGVLANDADGDAAPAPLTAVLEDDVSDGQLTLYADGSFTYTPRHGFSGTDSFTYRAYDGMEYTSLTTVEIEVVLDTTAPVVTVDPLLTTDPTPALSGAIDDPSATVTVTVNAAAYPAVNNGDGTWSLPDGTISPPLADGTYDVQAEATDPSDNTAYDATADELTVDTEAPTVSVIASFTNDTTPLLAGMVDDAGAAVTVTVDSVPYPAVNNGNGTWTLPDNTIPSALADGTYDVDAEAVDSAGNLGTDATAGELTVDTQAPIVEIDFLLTNDPQPELTGTVDDPIADVFIVVDGSQYTTTNNGNGTWTLPQNTIFPALADGVWDVFVEARDPAGNLGHATTSDQLTIRTQGPAVTVDSLATADPTPELTGTVDDPAATVTVTVAAVPYAAVNNGDGTWTLPNDTIDPALSEGTYDVAVAATDALGNVGNDATTDELTVDATAPTVDRVLVASTAWSAGFLAELGDVGYALPTGGDQLDELPWVNLNEVVVVFSEDAAVTQEDLAVYGVAVAQYTPTAFSYDAQTHAATWTLPVLAEADKLLLSLADTVSDAAGNALDGEWTDGISTYSSGDGQAGGSFDYRLNILPGDADQSSEVRSSDVIKVRRAGNTAPGDANYSANYDVDGSGEIRSSDVIKVRRLGNTALPAGEPTAPPAMPVGGPEYPAGALAAAAALTGEADTLDPAEPAEGLLDAEPLPVAQSEETDSGVPPTSTSGLVDALIPQTTVAVPDTDSAAASDAADGGDFVDVLALPKLKVI